MPQLNAIDKGRRTAIYVRISTGMQKTDRQVTGLKEYSASAGIRISDEDIFIDIISGFSSRRKYRCYGTVQRKYEKERICDIGAEIVMAKVDGLVLHLCIRKFANYDAGKETAATDEEAQEWTRNERLEYEHKVADIQKAIARAEKKIKPLKVRKNSLSRMQKHVNILAKQELMRFSSAPWENGHLILTALHIAKTCSLKVYYASYSYRVSSIASPSLVEIVSILGMWKGPLKYVRDGGNSAKKV